MYLENVQVTEVSKRYCFAVLECIDKYFYSMLEVKKPKPGGMMGFGISSADLFKTKLRPVSMTEESKKVPPKVEEPKKPMQEVPPFGRPEMQLPPGSQKRDLPDVSF